MGILDQIASGGQVVDVMGSLGRGAQIGAGMADIYRDQRAKQGLLSALESGDPQKMMAARQYAGIASPEFAKQSAQAGGLQTEEGMMRQKAALQSAYNTAMQVRGMTNPQDQLRMLSANTKNLMSAGIEPQELIMLAEKIHSGDAEGANQMMDDFINLGNQVFGAASDVKTGTSLFLGTVDGQDVPLQAGNDGRLYYNGQPVDASMVSNIRPMQYDPNIAGQRAYASETATQRAQTESIAPKEQAKSFEERQTLYIDDGIEAASSLPTINRSLELLNTVETGGIDKLQLYAKQQFGIEGGDEAELSTNLGKAVISQYRDIFGAQFTAAEGDKLDRIEAGLGKSTEGNKRVLENLKTLLERKAQKGIRAAEKRGDFDTADEIRSSMSFNFNQQQPANVTPELKAYADRYFGGDINKAMKAVGQ